MPSCPDAHPSVSHWESEEEPCVFPPDNCCCTVWKSFRKSSPNPADQDQSLLPAGLEQGCLLQSTKLMMGSVNPRPLYDISSVSKNTPYFYCLPLCPWPPPKCGFRCFSQPRAGLALLSAPQAAPPEPKWTSPYCVGQGPRYTGIS